ncbi:MAG: cysteine--tRNA ligase [Myxococcales bacterium]|nr:cysteine--tRNA ligase [Myxococcales bacterium]
MSLSVFNTRTKRVEPFVPMQPPVVRIYTCGLTVYAPMHIGHARTYCFWDLFRRWLEHSGYTVLAVVNYTDIDDRIMGKATDRGAVDVAEENVAIFRRDCRSLQIRDYAAYTRATDFVEAQVAHIVRLIEKGHAYVRDGEVFYDVASFEHYGQLAGRDLAGQEVGASERVQEDFARKKNPADFTLWKPSQPGQPSWSTGQPDWPSGRPGWHIECSAMSELTLGAQFDVHGGGIDNLFPHHENEVAQSAPLCGYPWVRYWMHPEHLDLRGEKMSKSLGNVIAVPDLIDAWGANAVRFFFASGHYRSKLGFSHELVKQCIDGFARVEQLVDILESRLEQAPPAPVTRGLYPTEREPAQRWPRLRHRFAEGAFAAQTTAFIERFTARMNDDLDTPGAIAALFDYVRALNAANITETHDTSSALAAYRCLVAHLWTLGVERPNVKLFPELAAECMPKGSDAKALAPLEKVLDNLVAARQQARANKDFARADVIRQILTEAGVAIEDTREGPRWKLTK